MVPEKTLKEKIRRVSQGGLGLKNKVETLDSIHEDGFGDIDQSQHTADGPDSMTKKQAADMKNILGYLNQGEWTQSLSIGSIMQL